LKLALTSSKVHVSRRPKPAVCRKQAISITLHCGVRVLIWRMARSHKPDGTRQGSRANLLVRKILESMRQNKNPALRHAIPVKGMRVHPPTNLVTQRGLGHGWMLLTIGIMVGFILGFILFLSRLPDEHYTLVETERGVEQYESSQEEYAFYDSLSDGRVTVPNAKADQMPSFNRDHTVGKYGAGVNQRPSAVQISDDLKVGAEVAPVELAAASPARTADGRVRKPVAATGNGGGKTVNQPTTVRRNYNEPGRTSYYLQAGAFTRADDAVRLRQQLNQAGMEAFVKQVAIQGKAWHRVRLGPFYDPASLNKAQQRLGINQTR